MLRPDSGVSALRFVLISFVLFVLTFGIVELGWVLFDKALITNASREGARAAVARAGLSGSNNTTVHPTTHEKSIKGVVTAYANEYLVNLGDRRGQDLTGEDITVTYFDAYGGEVSTPVIGGKVEVQVEYAYDFLVLPNTFKGRFDGVINLVGTTVLTME